ncbi:MAG: hypothetical protein R3Y29_08665 [bacterium]
MKKISKISVIGIGHVGSHIASSLFTQGVCNEIALIDKEQDRALAHALDLMDMSCYLESDAKIYNGTYKDLEDSDILFVSVCGIFSTQDRLLELEASKNIVDDIAPKILESGFKGVILSVSNPCDIIANYLKERTGLNVIGTGTMLDSARLKLKLAKALNISTKSVQGFMLGEHGNSQFLAKSLTSIHGIGVEDYLKYNNIDLSIDELEKEVIEGGMDIAKRKMCTEFGIGMSCAYLAKAILNDERKVLSCSTFVEEYGVYTSVPCIIGAGGVIEQVKFRLSEQEQVKFEKSCNVLREKLDDIRK